MSNLQIKKVLNIRLILNVLISMAISTLALADEGQRIVTETCASCHRVSLPAPGVLTLQEKMHRKGPPLYYAGNKYQKDWLQLWLQKPVRITPSGGEFWANSVVVTIDGDEIDKTRLSEHLAVDNVEAVAISNYLMTLKPFTDLIKSGEYEPSSTPKFLAEKDFRKFKGCIGCHQDEYGFGGVTGPELYTSMKRLKPEYIASYIRNPTAWEPRSLMPDKNLNDEPIYKLINYMLLLSEDSE